MNLFNIDFKNYKQIAEFIANNEGAVYRNSKAIAKIEKYKLKIRLSTGEEFKFNKYGKPIYQDIAIFAGFKNDKLYDISNEINKNRLDNLNELQLMELANKLAYLTHDLNIEKEIMVQRKSFNNIELATKDSYMQLITLDKQKGTFEVKTIGERFKNFRMADDLNLLDLKEYKNTIKSISDDSLLLKIKAYESGLASLQN